MKIPDRLLVAIEYAKRLIGTPYRWGGDDPMAGFDCSGLVQEVLMSVGMDPPGDQTAQALYDHFIKAGAKFGTPQPGALYFYGKSPKEIIHVGFGIEGISMIEAGGGGAKTLTVEDAIRQNAFVRVRPYNSRRDLVGTLILDWWP